MDMQLMKNENEALMRRKLVPVAMGFGLFFLIFPYLHSRIHRMPGLNI